MQHTRAISKPRKSRKNMTRPFLRTLVPTSLLLFGSFAGTLASAQQSAVATSTDTPLAPTQYASSLPSPVLWSSSSAGNAEDNDDQTGQAMPNAPQPSSTDVDGNGKQTKRILGVVPNFRAVSANEKLPPMSVKDKFITASEDSFDYSSIFLPAAIAGYDLARNATPEFGHGGVGYGRYLWHSAADQTSENYFVEFIGPTITHQD